MASKIKSSYVCSECGYTTAKWLGKCPQCGEWSTLEEVVEKVNTGTNTSSNKYRAAKTYRIDEIEFESEIRYKTGLSELDRVLGGGIVKGSLTLISGDPGIGKSTILLQICQSLGNNLNILYVSGEESYNQIKLRAKRLNVNSNNLQVLCDTDTQSINETILSQKPDLVIIDSIQTMNHADINASPGSVSQVRESTNLFMRTAKSLNIPLIIIGHVNKDGNIAGPKVLEHIVDAVLYFEGDRNLSFRILRAVKNRFGPTNEIGVFEMTDKGLQEILNPSQMLIEGRPRSTPGSCVACVMEGTRPILAEIQALVASTAFGTPRRMTNGFDYNRMNMLIAVLEKRGGFYFSNQDAYVNVIGGMKLDEPATDLPMALALVSSLKDYVIKEDIISFGEIGLAGEIRAISNCEQRVREAMRLGFTKCIIPKHNIKSLPQNLLDSVEIVGVRTIRQAVEALVL